MKMKDKVEEEDKLFEGLYYHLGKLQAEKTSEYLEEIHEEAQALDYPKEVDQWFMAYLKEQKTKEKKAQTRKQLSAVSKWVALFLVVLTGGLAVTTSSVEAFKIKLFNMVSEITSQYTSLQFVEEDKMDTKAVEITWHNYLYPNYLPEGFKLTEVQEFGNTKLTYFEDGAKKRIEFSQSEDSAAFQIDTEQAQSKKVTINGNEGWLVDKDGFTTLVWKQGDLVLYLIANLSDEELLKVAESIKWVEK